MGFCGTVRFQSPRGFQTETTIHPGGEPVGACMYVEKILLHIDFKYFRVGAKDIFEKRKLQGFCIQFESRSSSKFPWIFGSQRINCTLYTLESSHFEHNGGLVQMIFLCKWVISR